MSEKPQQATPSVEKPELTEVPRSELWNQLGHALSMAAKEDQIVWAIFGVFWAANAVLLVALFTTGSLPSAPVGIVVSATGVVLSCVWFNIQRRAIRWLGYFEKIIWQLESKYLKLPPDIALSAHINTTTFMETVGRGLRVRPLMIGSGFVTTLLWISTLLWFVCKFAT